MQLATFGGGCFWCLEAVFEQLAGVERSVSGYSGGWLVNPSYEAVCRGDTGHAEVVQLTYDENEIGYRELVEIFFAIHDPTTLNRQGNDVGTQYRSVIYTHTPEQDVLAEAVIADLNTRGLWALPIVTQVSKAPEFYVAESYHQGYFRHNPGQGYCSFVVGPKVAKFRQHFLSRLKPDYR